MVDTPAPDAVSTDAEAEPDQPSRWLVGAAALAILVGTVFRFLTSSPLWLDEALSVNIARLSIGDIPAALKQDGHPPLYYVLLHGWMEVFGESDRAVRALSGAWSLLLLPLAWRATRELGGRRAATYALILVAGSPFAVRYATETRMYSMLSVLAVAGYLAVRAAMHRPTLLRSVAVAVVTGLLLWTHYWAMWLLGATVALLVASAVRRHRAGESDRARGSMLAVGSMVVGGLTFLPWMGHLLYQSEHTGTPWARPMRPAEIVSVMISDFGGGTTGEATLYGWTVVALAVIGLVAVGVGAYQLLVDLRRWTPVHPLASVTLGTLVIACVAGYVAGATFASRYASAIHPFVMIMGALGIAQLRPRWLSSVTLVAVLALAGVGLVRNVTVERSDAKTSAEAINGAASEGDLIVYCPDQLGPSTSRLLDPGFEQVTYPAFASPERIDWVDYQARLDAASTAEFGAEALARAEGRNIFLVYSTSYDTHRDVCPDLFNVLGRSRPPVVLTEASEAYEPAAVAVFPAPEG